MRLCVGDMGQPFLHGTKGELREGGGEGLQVGTGGASE